MKKLATTLLLSSALMGCGSESSEVREELVYVFMGQSNMVGIPAGEATQPLIMPENALKIDFEGNVVRSDSFNYDVFGTEGEEIGSPHISPSAYFLFHAAVNNSDKDIVVVDCARSASTMSEQVEEDAFGWFLKRTFEVSLLQLCLNRLDEQAYNNIAGVFYYQGESDAILGTSHEYWIDGLNLIARSFPTDNFIVTVLNETITDDAELSQRWDDFKDMQRTLPYTLVETEGYTLRDGIHNDGDSIADLGYQYYQVSGL
jgi:hypothetical protein